MWIASICLQTTLSHILQVCTTSSQHQRRQNRLAKMWRDVVRGYIEAVMFGMCWPPFYRQWSLYLLVSVQQHLANSCTANERTRLHAFSLQQQHQQQTHTHQTGNVRYLLFDDWPSAMKLWVTPESSFPPLSTYAASSTSCREHSYKTRVLWLSVWIVKFSKRALADTQYPVDTSEVHVCQVQCAQLQY